MKTTAIDRHRVLVVDDDVDLLHLIEIRLKANNYDVKAVDSAGAALEHVSSFQPHAVVTDLKMPGMDGMALFQVLQHRDVSLPVIILTANGTIPDAVAATQQGVFSYLVKPFDAKVLLNNLERAIRLSGQPLNDSDVSDTHEWSGDIIYCSSEMEALLKHTRNAANSDASILIQSETGTGKELLAKAIHKASLRRDKPFFALNCAAIPETLIESELFGHAAGAFTGARKAHPGLFQAAHEGTLFLDEIGDMPLAAQAKLLRVLEQQEVRPVGSTSTIPIDVRIVAATHHDLEEKVKNDEFREDLYYRLDVISLRLPALRERRQDIPLLADHFCKLIAARNRKDVNRFSPEAMEMLISAPWPGNVRQLYNITEQCVVLSTTPIITRTLVERALRQKSDKLLSLSDAKDQFEHDYLVRLLNLTEGNIALASRLADRNRSEFYNVLRRHGLEPEQFRSTDESSE